jgi:hypothetical protein
MPENQKDKAARGHRLVAHVGETKDPLARLIEQRKDPPRIQTG